MSEKLSLTNQIESRQLSKAPVPLIAETIRILSEHGLNPLQDWVGYCSDKANKRHAQSYLLSLACRAAGDQTGILGPLIGVSQGPEDTRQILIRIEQELLKNLHDESKKQKVFAALNEGKIADAETILTIDELLGEAVMKVRQVAVERGLADPKLNNMTLEAFDFWLKNLLQLYRLLKQETNGNIFGLLKRQEKIGSSGNLVNITQKPIIPVIPEERAQLLREILPNEINRQINPQPPKINEPLGFISRLNMAGSDLFRYFAGQLRQRIEAEPMAQYVSTKA
jgi:hypothetical protein